jgi:hypothetical protein
MRFMIIRKADKHTEAGVMPSFPPKRFHSGFLIMPNRAPWPRCSWLRHK